MNPLGAIGRFLLPAKCPLCGGVSTYKVKNYVSYASLLTELGKLPQWQSAHGLSSGIPQAPAGYADEAQLPGFERGARTEDGKAHERCSSCHSLLPLEYLQGGSYVGKNFAVTVAGLPAAGKTTWLLNMLNPPESDTYELIRRTLRLETSSYEYAEPYTLKLLRDGAGTQFRTNIPYTLFGTTVKYKGSLVFVRTLDIMGEQFIKSEAATRDLIKRHLALGERSGALLVLDRYEPVSRKSGLVVTNSNRRQLTNIARAYEEIRTHITSPNGGSNDSRRLWSGVVWTHLDQATWNAEAKDWLHNVVPTYAETLDNLASSPLPAPSEVAAELLAIDEDIVWMLAGSVGRWANYGSEHYTRCMRRIASLPPFEDLRSASISQTALEGLICLLFRLQMLYSQKAANHNSGKFDYLTQQGTVFVAGVQALARSLYILWDRPRGGLHQFIREDSAFDVLACGLVGDRSVWSDFILLRALVRSDAIKVEA